MTTYTSKSLPLIESADKIAAPASNLRLDINALSEATDRALLQTDAVIDGQNTRLTAVEVLGGLAPGDVSDATVASLLAQPASMTGEALDSAIEPKLAPKLDKSEAATTYTTKETIREASDPLAYFSSIDVIATLPVRNPGQDIWVQGFSINDEVGEIYVASQATNGTVLTISIRNMDGTLKSSKTLPLTSGAYTESLPFFYSGTDLCFIVRTGAAGTVNTYNIFNYSTNTLSAKIPINGQWRIAVDGDVAVTSDALTNSITTFWMYSWDSIKSGSPTLLATMPVDVPGATAAKNQGLALVGSQIFLTQGNAAESPTFTAYSTSGRMTGVTSWGRASFAEKLNALIPGLIADPLNYAYEAEGATSHQGRLITGHTVSNNNPDEATFVLVGHGFIAGQKVSQKALTVPANTPWTLINATAPTLRMCIANGVVYGYIDGSVTLPDSTSTTVIASGAIPESLRPQTSWRFAASIAGYPAIGYVTAAGGVVIENKTGASRANINVSNFSYPLMRW